MDLFRDSKRVLWITSIRYASQQPPAHTPEQKWLFQGGDHPGSMEASMATHPILFNRGRSLVYNMLENVISTTSTTSSNSNMRSQKIGQAQNLEELTSRGTMHRNMPRDHAGSASRITLKTCFYDLDIRHLTSPNSRHTNTARSHMEHPNPKWHI